MIGEDPAAPPSQIAFRLALQRTMPADSSGLTILALNSRDSSQIQGPSIVRLTGARDTVYRRYQSKQTPATMRVATGPYRVYYACVSCDRVDEEWRARPGYSDTLLAVLRPQIRYCDAPPEWQRLRDRH